MVFQKYDETESGKMQTTEHHGKANVKLAGIFLEKPDIEKNFGIVFSSDFSWTTQSEKKIEKAMKTFWSIKQKFSKVLSWITSEKLYRSYVVPVSSYGSSNWEASKAQPRRIGIVQRKSGFLYPTDNTTGLQGVPAKTPISSTGVLS